MSRGSTWPLDCKVYVGGLTSDAEPGELEDAFGRYGRLKKVWVARRPPGFAFVEFDDNRDAEDAVRALDGTRLCGARVRVEMSNGRRRTRDQPISNGYSSRRRSRTRSRSPPFRRRSRTRSPWRRRSPRRSRSPVRRGRSYSRSRSRSRSR